MIFVLFFQNVQYTSAERVYGNGARFTGADAQRTHSYADKTVIPPLAENWSINEVDSTAGFNKGLTITNYRVYFGSGNEIYGLSDQTGESFGDYVVGNPFIKSYPSNMGTVSSAVEILRNYTAGSGEFALFFGTENGRVGKVTGIGNYDREGAQNIEWTSKYDSGPIKYLTDGIASSASNRNEIIALSDNQINVIESSDMSRVWRYNLPQGKFTGVTKIGSSEAFIATTSYGDSGKGLVYTNYSSKDTTVHTPDTVIEFMSGVPKNPAFENSRIYTVDEKGRIYKHDKDGTKYDQGYLGDTVIRGYNSVGGVLLHGDYVYASTLGSSKGANKGTITRLRKGNFDTKTSYIHDAPITTTPIFLSGLIYFGDSDGKVYALDPNTMKLVDWYIEPPSLTPSSFYKMPSGIETIVGADNHLIVAAKDKIVGLKGLPDFYVHSNINDSSQLNQRFNYTTGTIPTLKVKSIVGNQGSFDYERYSDFGGTATQKVDIKITNLDNGQITNVEDLNLTSNVDSADSTNLKNVFQVPAGKEYTLNYDFQPSQEGSYKLEAFADSSDHHKEINENNNSHEMEFNVVDMRKPVAAANKSSYRPGENAKFTLTKYQEVSYASYGFEVIDPSGNKVIDKKGNAFVKSHNLTVNERGTYQYRVYVKNRYNETIYGDWETFSVDNTGPKADFTAAPNPSDRLTSIKFTNKSTDSDGDTLSYQWHYRINGSSAWTSMSTATHPTHKFGEVKTYQVRLTVTDSFGESDSVIKNVVINNLSPTAKFSINKTPSDRLTAVNFTNNSSDPENDKLSYRWEYRYANESGWSEFSTSASPSYKFSKVGTYQVRLTVTDSYGAAHSKTENVVIQNLGPKADFTINKTPSDRLTAVSFTDKSTDPENDSLKYNWQYKHADDSSWTSLSTNTNPSHTFNKIGTYNVKLTVTDSHGAAHSITKNVVINNIAPVANFTIDKTPSDRLTSVKFKSTSTDAEKDSLTYQWHYRVKGTTSWMSMGTSSAAAHTFDQVKTYEVRLIVKDTYNGSDTAIKEVVIDNLKPKADFSINKTPSDRLTSVKFNNHSVDPEGDTLSYRWEYKHSNESSWSNFSTSTNPSHTFNKVGTYSVRLTVTDSYGATDSISKNVEIKNIAPVASFTIDKTPSDRLTPVKFTNKSTDPEKDDMTYSWQIQHESESSWTKISTATNPTHTFEKVGTYKVRLTATDSFGDNHSVTKNVVIKNLTPKADFTINKTPSDRLTPVEFTSTSTDPEKDQLKYQWHYRVKGTTAWSSMGTSAKVSHTFDQVKTYEIRLTVTDEYNDKDTIIKEVIIENIAPEISITYNPTTLFEGDSTTITMIANDDYDQIDIELFIKENNGEWQRAYKKTNATYDTAYTYTIDYLNPVKYEILARVTDNLGATGEDSVTFNVTPLVIQGSVAHTERWKEIHDLLGNEDDIFFSGERFLLSSTVTNNSVDTNKNVEVEVTFKGTSVNNVTVDIAKPLNELSRTTAAISHEGEIYEESMSDPNSKLKSNTEAYFDFKATWSNGVTKHDIVTIRIINDVYDFYKVHKTN